LLTVSTYKFLANAGGFIRPFGDLRHSTEKNVYCSRATFTISGTKSYNARCLHGSVGLVVKLAVNFNSGPQTHTDCKIDLAHKIH